MSQLSVSGHSGFKSSSFVGLSSLSHVSTHELKDKAIMHGGSQEKEAGGQSGLQNEFQNSQKYPEKNLVLNPA